MAKHSTVRPDSAVLHAWRALNPQIPWPTALGELPEPTAPDNSPSIRHRTIKQYRKGPQVRTVQAAPVTPKTPRPQYRIDAERRYAEKRRLARLQAQASAATDQAA